MTLEAKLIYELEPAVYFACAVGTAIPKGSFVTINDENIVVIATSASACIGITAEEKVATTDEKITIAVYLRGIFKVFVGDGAATVGMAAVIDATANNEVEDAGVNSENIVGRFLGTAADTESVMMLLSPFNVNLA